MLIVGSTWARRPPPPTISCSISRATAAARDGDVELLVLERGEGVFVVDSLGRRHLDGLSNLFCAQLGYAYGAEMAEVASRQLIELPFATNWGVAHPAAVELAGRLAEIAPGLARPRVLHERRLGVGGGRLEARPPVPHRERRAAAHQGDRARPRLPRRDARRAGVHRRARLQGAVWLARHRDLPRLEHERIPTVRVRARAHVAAARRDRGGRRTRGGGDDRDDHRRARAERRRLPATAGRATGRGCARSATATGSCSWPTR